MTKDRHTYACQVWRITSVEQIWDFAEDGICKETSNNTGQAPDYTRSVKGDSTKVFEANIRDGLTLTAPSAHAQFHSERRVCTRALTYPRQLTSKRARANAGKEKTLDNRKLSLQMDYCYVMLILCAP